MRRLVLAVVVAALATPTLAQNLPSQGTFAIGATLSSDPTTGAVDLGSGLNLSYLALDNLKLEGDFGIVSVENVATVISVSANAFYYVTRIPIAQMAFPVGGGVGLNFVSPSVGDSTTQFVLFLGGGAEYFISRHFSAQLLEGLTFNTQPDVFALATRVGLNWYF